MSRVIMQQALEALELCRQADMRTSTLLHADDAIEALRAALAEPEPKPVAFMFFHKISGHVDFKFTTDWYGSDWEQTPVYTTPPQRKPLTDEQMLDLISTEGGNGLRTPLASAIMLIRAVERAHGIGGEE